MNTGYQILSEDQIRHALRTELLVPRLKNIMASRAPGHCMRLTDLDLELMTLVGQDLRNEADNSQVYILRELEQNGAVSTSSDLFISSTKLVELRNPLPDGTLRSPLLVLLPPNLQASAEDSFGIATFEEITVSDIYRELVSKLLQRLPVSLQGHTKDILVFLEKEKWRWADSIAQARYLLTVLQNGVDGESLGAALYELGLVPDFRLFDDPTITYGRIQKNLAAVRKLTYSDQSSYGRVLSLGLSDKRVQRQLTQLLLETGVEKPHIWTRQIITNRSNWSISFDKWIFIDDKAPDRVSIEVIKTDLPVVAEDKTDLRLQNLIGEQVLNPSTKHTLKVTFQVEPHPTQVSGLDYFTLQIVAVGGGPIGTAKKVKAWKSTKRQQTASLTKLNKVEFEEGWHVIRVLPWTAQGDPIPLIYEDNAQTERPNESEPFYVALLDEEALEDEVSQRAVPRENSIEHARLKFKFSALLNNREPDEVVPELVSWADKEGKRATASEMVVAKFGRFGTIHVPVSRLLKHLEQRILASPTGPINWRMQIDLGQARDLMPGIVEWPRSAAVDSFLSTRQQYFAAVYHGEKALISQAAQFSELKHACVEYAAAYRDLLLDLRRKIEGGVGTERQQAITALCTVLSIDTIHITITDFASKPREALLVGPTHPLRALWLATWVNLADHWITELKRAPQEYIAPARDEILGELISLNIPATLPLPDGRVFTALDTLNPFWALYVAMTEDDTRGLLSTVASALNLSHASIGGATITGKLLASRIERYLIQHPYIQTLSINLFNPGNAAILADVLVILQKQATFSNLRYDIRLFVPKPEALGVGEAIEELLAPSETTSSEAIDAFSMPSGNHLFPKLSFATHAISEFREEPSRYRAHLSLLFDLFPTEEIGIGLPLQRREMAPLHGLIQEFFTSFQDDDSGTFWRRQPKHGEASVFNSADDLVDLLAQLPELMSGAIATVATGLPAFDQRPIITLGLDVERRELLHHIHETSDWVLTIDRNLGIEFFDHGGQRDRPDYIIDYIPGSGTDSGYQLMVTSRSLAELEAMLQPVLKQYGLTAEGRHAAEIFHQLRSLSGRLAMKLISSPTQQAEALGLALARLFLKYQGALVNQVVVPLDDHSNLFQSVKKHAEELGEAVTLQRTDLALFDLNAAQRVITCNLVEVKCYTKVGGLGAFEQLKEFITRQINHSEEVLREHFDPHLKEQDRPDRLLKTLELRTLLDFYLNRSGRYKLIEVSAAEEARILLACLEEGYSMQFTRSALVFDFDKPGTETPDREFGIEFHRIGVDLIQALIAEARPITEESFTSEALTETPSIPRLESAAFIVPERERSASWEELEVEKPQRQEPVGAVEREGSDSNKVDEIGDIGQMIEPPAEPVSVPATGLPDKDVVKSVTSDQETGSPSAPLELELEREGAASSEPKYDIVLGVQEKQTPQYGILGEASGRRIVLDLNEPHTISLFGVQGSGKSYTLGTIIEMACTTIPKINLLPSPMATVLFHYSPTQDYVPEFTSMVRPNSDAKQLAMLREQYGAEPTRLEDVVLLVPKGKLEKRKHEYPDLEVLPLAFSASELKSGHWKFLMGAVGSQSLYIRQIQLILKRLQNNLTLEAVFAAVGNSSLSDYLKELAFTRLQFAEEYIDDTFHLAEVIRPGRLVIVDLRDEFIEKDEALGLFVVLLQIFSEATYAGQPFNKLVVFDEAHKYIESQDLITGLIEVVREMRHKGTSILVASQDPPSVPISLIELSSQIILHKFNSPAWLKHIQRANAALSNLTPDRMSQLGPGEAYIWSNKASDDAFTKNATKIRCRPRVTQHGGGTRTAIGASNAKV